MQQPGSKHTTVIELTGLHDQVRLSGKEQGVGLISEGQDAATRLAERCDLSMQAEPTFTEVVVFHEGACTAG